jgi:hypothetical protein
LKLFDISGSFRQNATPKTSWVRFAKTPFDRRTSWVRSAKTATFVMAGLDPAIYGEASTT